MTISEVLAGCLDTKGITQEQAALAIGVKQSVVSRWVGGKDAPSDRYVPALVKFTGLRERNVLDAIHQQRLQGPNGLPNRVAALEQEMETVKGQLAELLTLLRGKQ
jgi:transcriptional regulator with XRE-family HTH domain